MKEFFTVYLKPVTGLFCFLGAATIPVIIVSCFVKGFFITIGFVTLVYLTWLFVWFLLHLVMEHGSFEPD